MDPRHHDAGAHAHLGGHAIRMPGGRARRGDIQVAIMTLLKEQDMHGYQMIQELSERSGGAWNPSPGSIYPALQLLEDQGMLASEQLGGRRVFSLTETGRTHADMLPQQAPWDEIAEESDPSRRLRETFGGLMQALAQIGRAGTPSQIDETVDILAGARKRIYQMLAGAE